MKMKQIQSNEITLAISPCPNDTFMFWAMLHARVDTFGMSFKPIFRDIAQLNQAATEQEFDVVKISYAHYPSIAAAYELLDSGSALGFGNGPLLVSRSEIDVRELPHLLIAIPGVNTTANKLLTLACPQAANRREYLFSEIEEAVLTHKADAGLLIHETRFTYAQKGLKKIIDLGEFWEKKTGGLPLPLGAIAVKRSLPEKIKQNLNTALRHSIEHAMQNPRKPEKFIAEHAKEMDMEVCRKHINLYVNEFSVALGERGRKAVEELLAR